jgi:hypothetical protein
MAPQGENSKSLRSAAIRFGVVRPCSLTNGNCHFPIQIVGQKKAVPNQTPGFGTNRYFEGPRVCKKEELKGTQSTDHSFRSCLPKGLSSAPLRRQSTSQSPLAGGRSPGRRQSYSPLWAVTGAPLAASGGLEVPAACCWAPIRPVDCWPLAGSPLDEGGKASARYRPRACRAPGDLLSGGSCCGAGRLYGPKASPRRKAP